MAQENWTNNDFVVDVLGATGKIVDDITELFADIDTMDSRMDELELTNAYGNTNFAGLWTSLTGAVSMGISVYHLNQYWRLTSDLTDITAHEPGVDAVWVRGFITVVNSLGDLAGVTTDIDYRLGDYVTATVSTSAQTFTFSNAPESGVNGTFVLWLTNGGSQLITWPVSVKWASGIAPTLTEAGVDILVFSTNDNGSAWYGSINALDTK